jgi:glycosyltransferase involved in cell wall biosynthesis
MAAGLAVIASDQGGPRELVDDGVNGLLFKSGDCQDLTRALRSLADNPTYREKLARAGQRRARRFVPEAIALEMLSLYRTVLQDHTVGELSQARGHDARRTTR